VSAASAPPGRTPPHAAAAPADRATTPARSDTPFLPPGERVILDLKPSMIFIGLGPAGWVFFVAFVAAAAAWALTLPGAPQVSSIRIITIAFVVIFARMAWEGLDWSARRYILSERRLISTRGIIRRVRVEIPLTRVQHLVVFRSLRERLVGAGTIGIATAGTGGIEMGWVRISDPDRVVGIIRAALEAIRASAPNHAGQPPDPIHADLTPADLTPADLTHGGTGVPPVQNSPELTQARDTSAAKNAGDSIKHTDGFLIVGIAGGIGSGKSAAANALADLGFLVVDSDAQAKAVLQRAEVRDQLVSWWGESILTPDRSVDRAKVAAIIFNAPAERARLEALVHPLIKASRAELVAAARAGTEGGKDKTFRGVVVDAPLLFEAGVDAECDAVIFVDTPRAARLARVRETRNWDEAELTRREQAQLSLEEKKSRSQHIITNDADLATLRARVAQLVREWESAGTLRRPSAPGKL
jgi:dephospho-CoA kinase